jgi:hypothetical protein
VSSSRCCFRLGWVVDLGGRSPTLCCLDIYFSSCVGDALNPLISSIVEFSKSTKSGL